MAMLVHNQRVIDVAFPTGGLGKDRGLATIFAQSIDTEDVERTDMPGMPLRGPSIQWPTF